MSEEKKTSKWFGWVKHIVSAIIGAIIAVAATFGLISKDEATIAQEKANGLIDKTEVVYVQVESVGTTVSEIKTLIEEKKYLEALSKLDTIKDNAITTVNTIKELKEEIAAAVEVVSTEAKEKAKEVKDVVTDAVDDVKEAVESKPEN